jgi:hypothetical protein
MNKLSPFTFSMSEAVTLVHEDNLAVNRKITSGFRTPQTDYTPSLNALVIKGLLAAGPYFEGQTFWVKEHFRVRYDRNKDESWFQYVSDNRVIGTVPIHGQSKFMSNGIYDANHMEQWMSRWEVTVMNVAVIEGLYSLRPSQKLLPKRGWCWNLTFSKKAKA